jgi:hypothetical protein
LGQKADLCFYSSKRTPAQQKSKKRYFLNYSAHGKFMSNLFEKKLFLCIFDPERYYSFCQPVLKLYISPCPTPLISPSFPFHKNIGFFAYYRGLFLPVLSKRK